MSHLLMMATYCSVVSVLSLAGRVVLQPIHANWTRFDSISRPVLYVCPRFHFSNVLASRYDGNPASPSFTSSDACAPL